LTIFQAHVVNLHRIPLSVGDVNLYLCELVSISAEAKT